MNYFSSTVKFNCFITKSWVRSQQIHRKACGRILSPSNMSSNVGSQPVSSVHRSPNKGMKQTAASDCGTGPPSSIGWRAGTTTRRHSRLDPLSQGLRIGPLEILIPRLAKGTPGLQAEHVLLHHLRHILTQGQPSR
jgi:hypothetical protein